MKNTIIYTHNDCFDHLTPPSHPEKPERLAAVLKHLSDYQQIQSREATNEDLLLCHPQDYIDLVHKEISDGKLTLSTGDVFLSEGSWKAALRSVGAVLDAVDAAFADQRSFAAIRPPGHHAETAVGMGFCLFNNLAIGARYAQKKYGIKKILIVDWDVHHGNGTEEIFLNDSNIIYFSTHESPLFPGTGLKSKGHMINLPIKKGALSRLKVLQAFKALRDQIEPFGPELVMISAGFDAHKNDPLGGFNLETEDYRELTTLMVEIADAYAGGKVVSVLEGGYDLNALSDCAKAHVEALDT